MEKTNPSVDNAKKLWTIHDDLGCDGWEISAHAASAPDHEPIQGKQYPDASYIRLNNSLKRRIGTLNCGHSAMPIIMGINEPQYTDEELEQFRRDNEQGFEYGGKHYTQYEATQRQRGLERSIRKKKRQILIDEKLGDTEQLPIDQTRYVVLRDEYRRFSKAAGLRTQQERMNVPGFGPKQDRAAGKGVENAAKEAELAKKLLEKQKELEYNRRKEEALQHIRSDVVPKKLNRGNQQKHIKDSPGYQAGKSYIYGDLTTAQDLVNTYHGTGEPVFKRNGEWNNKEIVLADHIIGVDVDLETGEEKETRRFVIHYGKKGSHVVPTKELEE